MENTNEVACFWAIASTSPMSLFNCSSHGLKIDCCLHILLWRVSCL